MSKRLFDLPETKGSYQLKGIVTGTQKDGFYSEKSTKNGKPFRRVNFGVEYYKDSTLFVNLQGMEQDKVYFYKKADNQGEKGHTQDVPWINRFSFDKEGYRLIGNNIGVKKIVNSEGKTVNDKKVLTDFDSCKEISDYLSDGSSVFIRGNIEYSSFVDDQGNKRVSTKLVPNQVSLCADCDFSDENYEKQNDFNQVIIFMGIDQEVENDKPTGRFIVSAKIVTYSNIEDVEFIIEDSKLANIFKKNLKPYNAIKVSGHMVSSIQTETVEDEDEWGESDAMERVSSPVKREFIITGAKPSTIDKELYNKDNIEDAIAKINNAINAENNFNDVPAEWGTVNDDDEDEAW